VVLGGRYEVREVLGRGGMAEVHRALDLRLGRVVAVKMLRADLARDPEFQDRFRREAQSAASLNHPTIVAVYDTGEDLVRGARVPFIVMELVEGATLRDLLSSGRRLLPERAMEITAGILTALDYSHRHGIVHRDIKPANVMLTPRGDIKVMDFGIARAVAEATSAMTQGSAVVGTAQYLSPEQARGEQVDARTDLYSTGCVLFELLTGRPPFVGESPVSVAYQHARELAPAPSTIDPSIPRAVDLVVLKALAKERGDRYQTAAEMRADIERARTGGAVLARPGDGTSATTVLAPVAARSTVSRGVPVERVVERRELAPPPRRHGGAYLLLALAVLAVVAGGIVLAQRYFVNDKVLVPNVSNLSVQEATARLVAGHLTVNPKTQSRPDATVVENNVVDTTPKGSVKKGTAVTLILSSGPDKVGVPSVVDKDYSEASNDLQAKGLVPVPSSTDSPDDKGTVVAQDPPANTPVLPGSTVKVTVSTGKVPVPNVVGKARLDAIQTLAASDGRFGYSSRSVVVTDPSQDGVVQSTIPDTTQGVAAAKGTKIILVIGK
jgi:beta-lactam-binding protein with PASTA domain